MVHHYLYKIQNQAMGPRVLIGFGGVYWSGASFHSLQNRNLNWVIFERSRGEENKRQFVNQNKG
jgi:hypothetical protein